MSRWRRVAIEKFPQFHRAIADVDHIGEMWWELTDRLKDAYRLPAFDEQFVADVYEYAH